MKKIISVFIDESGDFGFVGDASKYYLITLVFHNQEKDISPNIEKIAGKPVFHAGPLIRREYPFKEDSLEERRKIFQSIFMFVRSIPITFKTFVYNKKDFQNDIMKMEAKMSRDIFIFFNEKSNDFLENKKKVYYDNGQHQITKIINNALAITGLNYEIKKEVKSNKYRLFQVADFISTIKLLEVKMNNKCMTLSEEKFINRRNLKNTYLRSIEKKEYK